MEQRENTYRGSEAHDNTMCSNLVTRHAPQTSDQHNSCQGAQQNKRQYIVSRSSTQRENRRQPHGEHIEITVPVDLAAELGVRQLFLDRKGSDWLLAIASELVRSSPSNGRAFRPLRRNVRIGSWHDRAIS